MNDIENFLEIVKNARELNMTGHLSKEEFEQIKICAMKELTTPGSFLRERFSLMTQNKSV